MLIIRVDEAVKRITKDFQQLSAQAIAKATANALNVTIRKGRTAARSEVKKVYNVPQRYMSRVNYIPATVRKLQASIYGSSKPIPMDAFSPRFQIITGGQVTGIRTISKRGVSKARSLSRGKLKGGVSIEIKKGDRVTVPYAFLLPNAKPRVFARGEYRAGNGSYGFIQRHTRLKNDAGNDSVKPLTTVTIFGMMVNPVVNTRIVNIVRQDFDANMIKAMKFQISLMN